MTKILLRISIWYFQSLCKISREKLSEEGLLKVDWAVTDGVWQRGNDKEIDNFSSESVYWICTLYNILFFVVCIKIKIKRKYIGQMNTVVVVDRCQWKCHLIFNFCNLLNSWYINSRRTEIRNGYMHDMSCTFFGYMLDSA